eukprot:Skav201739  [mRNA]  locus=scaffold2498:181055:189928:+ [translate_table: standard]
MGRGPPPPSLPSVVSGLAPIEGSAARTPRTPRQMAPLSPRGEAEAPMRRLKRPVARYFPAEEAERVTLPSRPTVPKPAAPRPLNSSLKGFCWRVTEERIQPSADLADKVYFAPVVPGIPVKKRPRRPRVLEPLVPAPIAQLRNKAAVTFGL